MSSVAMAMSFSDVWNEILAPKFIRYRPILVAGAEPHGRRAMALFGPALGDRTLDVGCGFGDATLDLAERVGLHGTATGLDVAAAFLSIARQAASESGAPNVDFIVGDAETFRPPEPFDYLFARFGTMFFERPLAAFRNMRAMLKPDGELVMTTWRNLEENPWLAVAKRIAKAHLPRSTEDAVTCGPGPFSLSNAEMVRALLTRAGFRTVSFVPSDAPTLVGSNLEEAIDFQLAIGPAGEVVREAGPAGLRALPALRKALSTALAPFCHEDGVRMPAAAWIVHALA
jgi:ubiquinone/menaquinone biosynthesis C-methylase UbiE